MTPEGRVKDKIDRLLNQFPRILWYHKPVQNGMGSPCLDYHCCYKGKYFAIEAKAPNEPPTARQAITIREIKAAGGTVFVVNDDASLDLLRQWLMEKFK